MGSFLEGVALLMAYGELWQSGLKVDYIVSHVYLNYYNKVQFKIHSNTIMIIKINEIYGETILTAYVMKIANYIIDAVE